jgi:hypothetical protein
MRGYLITALDDVWSAICIADNAVGELREKVKCNSSFFDTLGGYQNAVKRARQSYDVIKRELENGL